VQTTATPDYPQPASGSGPEHGPDAVSAVSTRCGEHACGDGLLTEQRVAERLGVTIFCVRKWRARQVGPPWVKLTDSVASAVRYDSADLDAWIESRKHRPRTKQ
jgi:predicted DNA-binding transcriptional regulator AlpA